MAVLDRLFDEAFYLESYPDVRAAVQAGIIPSGRAHFETSGIREGRTLISRFYRDDVEFRYLAANQDVAAVVAAGGLASGLQHYLGNGEREGRSLFGEGFDEAWYRRRYPDVDQAINQGVFTSGLEHYLAFGRDEVRSVSQLFELDYFNSNGDVRAFRDSGGVFLSAADHFVANGRLGGRPATFSGTRGNDTVIGSAVLDTITGVELDVEGGVRQYDSLGVSEQDVLIGGSGADAFELGYILTGQSGTFGIPFYRGNEDRDFARIQNFDVNADSILLPTPQNVGGATPEVFLEAQADGVHVSVGVPRTPTPIRDLIAVVEGVANPSDIVIGAPSISVLG